MTEEQAVAILDRLDKILALLRELRDQAKVEKAPTIGPFLGSEDS